ncbi:MAG: penicillin-binding protein [Actinomycetota bacterium]|nr:penicillin-binding protein [Actinomycetota bacterium]
MGRNRRRAASAFLALAALAATSCSQLTNLPRLKDSDLDKIVLAQSSRIYAGDGELITTLHGPENRTVVPNNRIPKNLKQAVVAIEDERFYQHNGVDVRAILRALVANVTSGEVREGGSTITQQYVKNALIAPGETAERTLERKINEAALARQLETKLTKRQILARYLNTVYFGKGAYGIQAAARTYFSKAVWNLTLPEIALIAGVIRSPESYDPFDKPKAAIRRRDLVLSQMEKQDYITSEQSASAQAKRLNVVRGVDTDRYPAPYFIDYVKRLIKYDPRFENVGATPEQRESQMFQGGLRIYTTVDLAAQRAAEQAIDEILYQRSDPHGSLVAIDPNSGYVKAMVGGRDFFASRKEDRFAKLNLATVIEPDLDCVRYEKGKRVGECKVPYEPAPGPGAGRQAGSAFKPFTLETAIEAGIPLSKTYDGSGPLVIPGADNGADYTVNNYEGSAFGKISLLEATVNSVNVVYAQLGQEVGVQNVVDTAAAMGIRTPLGAYASAVLGTNSINPLDMASAYGTLATNGDHHPPIAIKRIVDPNGEVLYKDETELEPKVIDPAAAYITTTALEQAATRGTGVLAVAGLGRPAAGKTGTAQEYRDAWFVGYTPDLVASVWVGYPEGQIEMKPSCSGSVQPCRVTRTITSSGVTGGSFPAQIWNYFMLRALADIPASDFTIPAVELISVTVDNRNFCVASRFTPEENRETISFPEGTEPTKKCRVKEDLAEIPNVVGFASVSDAIELVERAGFEVETVDEYSDSYPPGVVVSMSPAGGSKALKGSTVSLGISTKDPSDAGPGGGDGSDENQATVPSVLGLTRAEAEGRLQSAGFEVNAITEAESAPGQARKRSDRVWKQSPSSGSSAPRGSTVTIYVNP